MWTKNQVCSESYFVTKINGINTNDWKDTPDCFYLKISKELRTYNSSLNNIAAYIKCISFLRYGIITSNDKCHQHIQCFICKYCSSLTSDAKFAITQQIQSNTRMLSHWRLCIMHMYEVTNCLLSLMRRWRSLSLSTLLFEFAE